MEKENAAQYIPQQQPFIMVDDILQCEGVRAKTSFTITQSNLLVDNGKLSEAGIIENIAQSCAARIGYIGRHAKNESIKIGMIGAVKDLNILRLPLVGETIETTLEETANGIFNMTILNAKVFSSKQLIAYCEIKVVLTDKEIAP